MCPELCSNSGSSSEKWNRHKDNKELLGCKKPVLLDFALDKPVDDGDNQAALFACSGPVTAQSSGMKTDAPCDDRSLDTSMQAGALNVWSGDPANDGSSLVIAAEHALSQLSLESSSSGCSSRDALTSFGYANGSFSGIYVGGRVRSDAAVDMVKSFRESLNAKGVQGNQYTAQICGGNHTAGHTVGMVIVASSDLGDMSALGRVQRTVRLWQNGTCASDFETSLASVSTMMVTINEKPARGGVSAATNPSNLEVINDNAAVDDDETSQDKDDKHTCKTEKVVSGDTCGSLAKECGITGAQFMKFNHNKADLCSKLMPGQHVCCSKGRMPDFTPKPYKNGTCFTYKVRSGDTCSGLAASHSITTAKINNYNQHTWGWMGCNDLQAYMNICLSPGKPPLPAPITGTRCGPQKPGTKMPKNSGSSSLARLNPCPLNACCDIWGQCGVTPEFCHKTQSKTGAPGTAKNGTNGCISHCGLDVVKGDAPSTFRTVA